MKKIVPLLILSCFFFSFGSIGNKKIIGHWISKVDLYDMKVNDTLIFTKTTYTDKLYQWTGALAGIELNSDNTFSEYHNVLCSDETSPIRFSNERWSLHSDLITIAGNNREAYWRVLNVNNKKLTVVVLKINSK
ncbi:hypothetical protein BH10BAC1_BH10BAC1_14610 [soil metagenome]